MWTYFREYFEYTYNRNVDYCKIEMTIIVFEAAERLLHVQYVTRTGKVYFFFFLIFLSVNKCGW